MHATRHKLSVLILAWLSLTSVQAQPLNVLVSFDVGKSGINQPSSELLLSGSRLFGTTYAGGTNGYGTIFSINTDGTDLKVLYSFAADTDGAHPRGHLIRPIALEALQKAGRVWEIVHIGGSLESVQTGVVATWDSLFYPLFR